MNAEIPAAITLVVLVAYELWFVLARRSGRILAARTAHATLREDWFEAVSAQPGSEVLAVQTLRNSVMSASMTASTALLALLGSITLAAPSLQEGLEAAAAGTPAPSARLAMELAVLLLLFSSLVSSVMAVRYYTHASFIGAMPVGSGARQRWAAAGIAYVRRAGLLYSWSLRHLLLIVPLAAFLLHPWAAPAAALIDVLVLRAFDRARLVPAET